MIRIFDQICCSTSENDTNVILRSSCYRYKNAKFNYLSQLGWGHKVIKTENHQLLPLKLLVQLPHCVYVRSSGWKLNNSPWIKHPVHMLFWSLFIDLCAMIPWSCFDEGGAAAPWGVSGCNSTPMLLYDWLMLRSDIFSLVICCFQSDRTEDETVSVFSC